MSAIAANSTVAATRPSRLSRNRMSSCLVVSVTAVAGPPRRSDRAPDRRSDGPARLRRVDLDIAEAARGERRAELVRRPGEDRERPVVHRQDVLHAEQLDGVGRPDGSIV